MRLHIVAGSAGLLFLAAAPARDTLKFAPAEGTSLTKTFTTAIEFGLDDLLINVNGQEIDPIAMSGGTLDDASGTVEFTIEVTDAYGKIEDGRPLTLERKYESLTADYETGDGNSGSDSLDELEGQTVVFTWQPDSGTYALSSPDEDFDAEKAAVLLEDMDHRALLPPGDVEVDDTWQVSGAKLVNILMPGVDFEKAQALAREGVSREELPFDFEGISGQFVSGTSITCTYKGLREVDGADLQVIALAGELEQAIDLSEVILEAIRANAPAEFAMDLTADLELAGELTGEALWDAKAGILRTAEWTLELAIVGTGDVSGDAGGQQLEADLEVELSATIRRGVSVK